MCLLACQPACLPALEFKWECEDKTQNICSFWRFHDGSIVTRRFLGRSGAESVAWDGGLLVGLPRSEYQSSASSA